MLVPKAIIGGKIYRTGDKLRLETVSDVNGYVGLLELKMGAILEIVVIKQSESNKTTLFGLCTTDNSTPCGWHDLDGFIIRNMGYFVETRHIVKNFSQRAEQMVVGQNFSFKKKNLKDMKCRVVSPMPGNSESVVEFEEDIGGCGADGLGRGGHCLVIPNNILRAEEKKVKAKAKKKKK